MQIDTTQVRRVRVETHPLAGGDIHSLEIPLTPRRRSWTRVALEQVEMCLDDGFVPGASVSTDYRMRVMGLLADGTVADVTPDFLETGWNLWVQRDREDPDLGGPRYSPEHDARMLAWHDLMSDDVTESSRDVYEYTCEQEDIAMRRAAGVWRLS